MSEQTDYDRATNEQLSCAAVWLAGVASRHPDASQAVKTDAVIHGTAIALRLENDAATIATQAAQIEALKPAFERAGRIINALQGYLGERALSSAVYSELQQHAEDRAALSNTGKK